MSDIFGYEDDRLQRAPVQWADLSQLNTAAFPTMQAPRRGLVGPALSAGVDQLQGSLGAAASAVGQATGWQGLRDWGAGIAERNAEEAARNGRPDLETPPWREGGGGLAGAAPWAAYQFLKNTVNWAPQIAGAVAAAPVAGSLGLGLTGARIAGALAGGIPSATGQMFGSALDRERETGEQATTGEALASMALSPVYAGMEALVPARAVGTLAKGAAGTMKQRVARGLVEGAATETVTEGIQTAMEMGFRPDLSLGDKARNIVDAALTGGVIGGMAGGLSSLRAVKQTPPNEVDNESLKAVVDERIAPAQPMIPGVADREQMAPGRPGQDGQIEMPLGDVGQPAPTADPRQGELFPSTSAYVPGQGQLEMPGLDTGQREQMPLPFDQPVRQAQQLVEASIEEQPSLPLKTSKEIIGDMRMMVAELTGREKPDSAVRGFVGQAKDEVDLVSRAIDRLRSGKGSEQGLKIAEAIAARYGVLNGDRDALTQQAEAAAQEYGAARAANDPQALEAARSKVAASVRAIEMLDAVEQRRTPSRATQATSAAQPAAPAPEPVAAAPSAPTTPFNSQLAEQLGPVQRQLEFDRAVAQRDAALQTQREADLPLARAQDAETRPAVFDVQAAAGGNRVMDPARAKTIAALNALPAQQQEAVVQQYGGDVNAVLQAVGAAKSQKQLRAQLARVAGTSPQVFEQATPTQVMDTMFLAAPATQPRTAAPMSDAAINRSWAKISQKLSPQARAGVVFVDNSSQLPTEVLQQAQAQGFPAETINGVLHQGKTYIVRSNVRSEADLQTAVFHEVFGHAGLRKLLGADADATMEQLFDAAGGVDGLRAIARKYGVEQEFALYIPEGEITREQKIILADEMLAQAAGKATGKFSTAVREWMGRVKQALVKLLDKAGMKAFADRLATFSDLDTAVWLGQMRRATEGAREAQQANIAETAFLRTPQGMNEQMQALQSRATDAFNALDVHKEAKGKLRKTTLGWSSVGHIVDRWRNDFNISGKNGLQMLKDAHYWATATGQHLSQMFSRMDGAAKALRQQGTGKDSAYGRVNRLMLKTELQIDPEKSPEQHTWLQDRSNWPALRREIEQANEDVRWLKQKDKGAPFKVYADMRATNEAFNMAEQVTAVYNLVKSDPLMSTELNVGNDPMDGFKGEITSDPTQARAYWQRELDRVLGAAQAYVDSKKPKKDAKPAEGKTEKQPKGMTPLQVLLSRIYASKEATERSPYFHLGRTGDYFVAFDMAADEVETDGKKSRVVNESKKKQLIKALAEGGFDGVQITEASDKQSVFIRVETADAMDKLFMKISEMQGQGVVSKDKPPKRAQIGQKDFHSKITQPQWMQDFINSLAGSFTETEGMSDREKAQLKATRARVISQAQMLWLDSLPDTAIAKTMVHRENVPGYHSDMYLNFAKRMQTGVLALTHMAASNRVNEAFRYMHGAVNAAKTDGAKDIVGMQDVLDELTLRESERALTTGHNWVDVVRAVNHAFFLGMSPAYALINTTQLGVLLWPELAKRHGYAQAAKMIWQVTPVALRVMQATFNEAKRSGWGATPDANISDAALKSLVQSGKLSQGDYTFLSDIVGSGFIDIGAPSRQLGLVAEGRGDSKTDAGLRWAAMFGYYTETTTRLVAALAANKLSKGDKQYVANTIEQSMLNYQTWFTARQMGKMGFAGKATPIMMAFHTYTAQLIEKLYRESYDAIAGTGKDAQDTARIRKEARVFLGGHLGAVTVLAGSLGMPAASVIARAAESLVDAFSDDDEPYDVKAAWRNFLGETFGKDVGEVLSRGLPRALGIDLSTRAGEQDLLPFSKLLTDRRKWEDASKDFALSAMGSPVSMMSGFVAGGRDLMKGDLLGGLKKMAPVAVKGPIEAFRMTNDGYVDTNGNKMPMSVEANDILAQALGFSPAEKGEYNEARMTHVVRKQDVARAAADIRGNLISAIREGDRDAQREWLSRAKQFDRNNPEAAILPRLAGAVQRKTQNEVVAERFGLPIGVGVTPENRGLARYSNF